jgi:N-acetylmuramoyl-L-alanine amidase
MKITPCLLDISNNTPTGDGRLSERIRGQNKEHLWDDRPPCAVDTIVIHSISAGNVEPRRPFSRTLILGIFSTYGVSSHYLVERTGHVLQLVPEDKKAWHAGGSIMPPPDKRTMANAFSIGIELVATPHSGFTEKQYSACARLCRDIERRHGRVFNYVGHEDIAGETAVRLGLRKDLKVDPGPLFDWNLFRTLVHKPAA